MKPLFSILTGGILPFSIVFVAHYFLLNSIWLHQFYSNFGFLAIVFVILVLTCAEIAIIMCYFQLCSEVLFYYYYYISRFDSLLLSFLSFFLCSSGLSLVVESLPHLWRFGVIYVPLLHLLLLHQTPNHQIRFDPPLFWLHDHHGPGVLCTDRFDRVLCLLYFREKDLQRHQTRKRIKTIKINQQKEFHSISLCGLFGKKNRRNPSRADPTLAFTKFCFTPSNNIEETNQLLVKIRHEPHNLSHNTSGQLSVVH